MRLSIIAVLLSSVLFSACASSPVSVNSNSDRVNSVNAPANGNSNGGWTKVEAANGSNANSAPTTTIASPTPLPYSANSNGQPKPGTTPTPGIPDAANIRKQMQRNADAANTAIAVNQAMNANRASKPTVKNSKKQPGTIANKVQ